MQTLDSYVATAQLADRHATAATARTARRARAASAAPHAERLVLRRAAAEDDAALARLARLDSAARPGGDVLLAELDDEIVAAVPLAGGRAIADPFRPTADIVALLRLQAAASASRRAPAHRLLPRLPHVRVA